MTIDKAQKGALLALTGALFWGIMGIASQYLMQDKEIPAWWIMNMRMITAGPILLLADAKSHRDDFFAPWEKEKSALHLIFFAFVTLLSVQYIYLMAVYYINAAIATVFIGTEPIIILLWVCLRQRRRPKGYEALCCAASALGVALIATHGDFTSLSISTMGLIFGFLLAISGAIYTAQPEYLMRNYRPANVVGWGLFLSGVAMLPFVQPWNLPAGVDMSVWLVLVYMIVCGTALAFWMFLSSLQYIKPHIASIYEMMEPLSAVVLSLLVFDIVFGIPEVLGSILILAPVIILAVKKEAGE